MVNKYMSSQEAEASSPYGGGTPTTAAQADAQNTVGQRNRADVGLGGYGGRTSAQLDEINQQTQQQQSQKNQQEQDRLNYEQRARVNAGNRPGYTDTSELGDTRTQNFLKMRDQMAMLGMPVPDEEVFAGGVLEGQRKIAETTPGTRDDQFFTNELTKWNHNPIELSSAYHDVGMNAGVLIPANPFENRGDVALAFEKGGNQRDFTVDRYGFNPNVGNMIGKLPNGQGLQETAWTVAKMGKPANVDFQPAIDYQVSQKGKYGPYGYLEGGIVDKVDVSVPSVREPTGTLFNGLTVMGASVPGKGFGTVNKDWNPFVASAAEPSGFISEGIQLGKTEKPIVAPQVANPNGSFVGNALAGKFTPEQEKMLEPIKGISQTISGGVNFAFSIPVGIAAMIPFSPIKPWAPKDLEVVEKSNDPLKETIVYGEPTRTISGGNETITNLGENINRDKLVFGTQDSEINALLKGKVVDGKYAGSPEGYAIVSDKITKQNALSDTINKNVGTYNEMQRQNPIVETTTTPQTVITSGTPDKVYAFGYWQKASEEWGNKAMGVLGYNREQLDTYGETLKSKPGIGGDVERLVYNVGKSAIESPMDLPVYYLEGRMIAGGSEGVALRTAEYGQSGTGTLAGVARVLTTPGEGGVTGGVARTVTKWSLPVALTAGMGYEATNKGTDFSKETILTNLESGVVPIALMTYGAIGFGRPTSVELGDRQMQTRTNRFDNEAGTASWGGTQRKPPSGIPDSSWDKYTKSDKYAEVEKSFDGGDTESYKAARHKLAYQSTTQPLPSEPSISRPLPEAESISKPQIQPQKTTGQNSVIDKIFKEGDSHNFNTDPIYQKGKTIFEMGEDASQKGWNSPWDTMKEAKMKEQGIPIKTRGKRYGEITIEIQEMEITKPKPLPEGPEIIPYISDGTFAERYPWTNLKLKTVQQQRMEQLGLIKTKDELGRVRWVERIKEPEISQELTKTRTREIQKQKTIKIPVWKEISPIFTKTKERSEEKLLNPTKTKTMELILTPTKTTELTKIREITKPVEITRSGQLERTLTPTGGLPPILPLPPFLPSGGSGGYGKKRKGRKFTELFPMGILAGVQAGYNLKTPKMARPKKGKVIPKSMLTPARRKKK